MVDLRAITRMQRRVLLFLTHASAVAVAERVLRGGDNDSEQSGGNHVTGAITFVLITIFLMLVCGPLRCRQMNRATRNGLEQERQNRRSSSTDDNETFADFKTLLSATTMQVKSTDLVMKKRDELNRNGGDDNSIEEDPELGDNNVQLDVKLAESDGRSESSVDTTEHSWVSSLAENNMVLQLPLNDHEDNNDDNNKLPNAGRLVPLTCAICLASYREGDSVSWSATPECCHAYHTSCIVHYAETSTKKQRHAREADNRNKRKDIVVSCPLCRKAFVQDPYQPTSDSQQ